MNSDGGSASSSDGVVRILADVGPADRDGDDLRARGDDRRAGLREILVFAGPDEEARTVGAARDLERIDDGREKAYAVRSCGGFYPSPLAWDDLDARGRRVRRQPPPTAPTISSASPAATGVSA